MPIFSSVPRRFHQSPILGSLRLASIFRMFQAALLVLAAHGILGLGIALLPAKALLLRYACVLAVCLSTYKARETFDGLR